VVSFFRPACLANSKAKRAIRSEFFLVINLSESTTPGMTFPRCQFSNRKVADAGQIMKFNLTYLVLHIRIFAFRVLSDDKNVDILMTRFNTWNSVAVKEVDIQVQGIPQVDVSGNDFRLQTLRFNICYTQRQVRRVGVVVENETKQ